jgi:glycosyltransferase involved in cell wall biosynthesis
MRVVLVSLYHQQLEPEAWIAADHTRRGIAEALVRLGYQVSVVQNFWKPATIRQSGVDWYFEAPAFGGQLMLKSLEWVGDRWPGLHTPAIWLLPRLQKLKPELIHSFDLTASPTLLLLGRFASKYRIPLLSHYHGGVPAQHFPLRQLEQQAISRVRLGLFATEERAALWPVPYRLLPETSTDLKPLPKDPTLLSGNPALLCCGRLDVVKDPLTLIDGLYKAALPEARLHLCYTDSPLIGAVKKRVQSLGLEQRVVFHGHIPEARLQAFYSSADLYVQASLREVFGRAPLEALACGTPGVLSDIPSFRQLTDSGRIGRLFPVGDSSALAAALNDHRLQMLEARHAARALFEERFSFDRIAARLSQLYGELRV